MNDKQGNTSTVIYLAPLNSIIEYISKDTYGVFSRYLHRTLPNGKIPLAYHGRNNVAFAVGGGPLGRPEAAFHWIFGDKNAATSALCQFLGDRLEEPKLYFRMDLIPIIVRHFSSRSIGVDHIYVHKTYQPRADIPNSRIILFDRYPTSYRVHIDIEKKLPPKAIWDECNFQYAGLEVDGEIRSVLEYTVDDGAYCAIQQVFTPEVFGGLAYSKSLLIAATRAISRQNIAPIYLCDSNNRESIALARSAGFEFETILGVVGG